MLASIVVVSSALLSSTRCADLMSLPQLAALNQPAQMAFNDMSVIYDFDILSCAGPIQGKPESGQQTYNCILTRTPAAHRLDEEFEFVPEVGKKYRVVRTLANDGLTKYVVSHTSKLYLFETAPQSGVHKTLGDAFLDFNLVNPDRPEFFGIDGQSRSAIFRSPSLQLRSALESVSNVECHVVDDLHSDGQALWTGWFDAARGCIPMKQCYYVFAADGTRSLAMEFRTTKVHEVQPGVWAVVEGEKHIFPNTDREIVRFFKVREDYAYSLVLGSVSTPIVPEQLPGYRVVDQDAIRQQYMIK